MPNLIEIPAVSGEAASQLLSLQKSYQTAGDEDVIKEVLTGHASLHSLLMEAVQPLHRAFGPTRVLCLRGQSSDDENLVSVIVRLPASFGDPEAALRAFDADWWLANCHRSDGVLAFDYETRDAL